MEQTPGGNHWKDHYASERERLIAALGTIPDGGIIEQIEHVGATSIPGLFRQPCVDIALAVWPFPLEASAREALASLGYELDPGFASAPEQRFRHASGMFRLYLIEPGSPLWTDYILVSEYLRHDEAARQTLSAGRSACSLGKWRAYTRMLKWLYLAGTNLPWNNILWSAGGRW